MPRTVDHEQRRAQLTEVTAREIVRVGLEGVRLRDVAKAAGWTTGAVSHYFPDKRALLLATFRSRTELAERRFRETATSTTDLDAKLATILPINAEQTLNWQVWLAFWGAAIGDEELAAEQRRRYHLFRDGLAESVQAEQRAGRFRADAVPQHEALRLVTLLDGIAVQALFVPEVWPPEAQLALLVEHLAPLRADHIAVDA